MKKIAAILLLTLMIFNLAGYRILFIFLEDKATVRLEYKISTGQYSDDQLLEIRIPLSMPYYSDKDYESVYGETDWNGKHYRYVKRKISGNTLYLLCIPDQEKNRIADVKKEFTKAVNDIPANNKNPQHKNTLFKLLTTEFRVNETTSDQPDFTMTALTYVLKNSEANDLFIGLTDTPPPEFA